MYTGNIGDVVPSVAGLAVYPCVYREHTTEYCVPVQMPGLSLCIQGTFEQGAIINLYDRFIPVYTGNIVRSIIWFVASAVYPCVYREHVCPCINNSFALGLSLCIQGT